MEIGELICEAWGKVKAQLEGRPGELEKRLRRRGSKSFRRHPRPWCLAVKASDRRIDDYFGWDPRRNKQWTGVQRVEMTARLVRRLTQPIAVDRPCERKIDLAARLGVGPPSLRGAIERGEFTLRRIPLLGGQKGMPVPVIHTPELLDPGSCRGYRMADPVWGTHQAWLCERVPENLRQILKRVAVYANIRPKSIARERPYEPPKDYVWHRWNKNGEYIYRDHDRRLAARREKAREKRRREILRLLELEHRANPSMPPPDPDDPNPRFPPRVARLRFMGFRWICPRCRRKVKLLLYPLFAVKAYNLLGADPPIGSELGMPRPEPVFACRKCHRVGEAYKIGLSAWNYVVTQMSGGLLYGREVPRPQGFGRVEALRPGSRPRAAPRQEEIKRRLLAGETFGQIARELKISRVAVHASARMAYRKEGVRTLAALARLHNVTTTLPGQRGAKTARVQELMLKGYSTREIAADLKLTVNSVSVKFAWLYRKHGVHSRQELLVKLRPGADGGCASESGSGEAGPSMSVESPSPGK